jgi:hypothetical protein|tara:strand:+ start:729 stop:839 length:111 start_codon:yes stop_codon:yes gene_type:complete
MATPTEDPIERFVREELTNEALRLDAEEDVNRLLEG